MAAFNTLIDAHLHGKATLNARPSARKNTQPNRGRGVNGKGGGFVGQQCQQEQPITDTEKKRRQIMKGICFRCASADHFANICSLAKDIKCKQCNLSCHIAAACTQSGQAKSNATGEQEEKVNSSLL